MPKIRQGLSEAPTHPVTNQHEKLELGFPKGTKKFPQKKKSTSSEGLVGFFFSSMREREGLLIFISLSILIENEDSVY